MDPYLLLEVPHTATIEEIKKAYRKMALKWHPDKNGGSLDAAEMFRKIKAAYDCLIDPIKRATEDRIREKAEAAKKAEAHRQARARTHDPHMDHSRIKPWAVHLGVLAFVLIIIALFSREDNSRPTAA